jgi:hypothetical protein
MRADELIRTAPSAHDSRSLAVARLLGCVGRPQNDLAYVAAYRPNQATSIFSQELRQNSLKITVILLASFGTFIPMAIERTNDATRAIGEGSLSSYVNQDPVGMNSFLLAILLIVLLWTLFRLVKKAFWRLGLLAVLLPIGPLCMVAWAIPPLRGLTYWWSRTWLGLLLSQIPSVLALTIGVAVMAYAVGILSFFVSLAFLELAVDLYDIVGGIGQHGTYGFAGSVARTLGVGAVATTLSMGPAVLASAGATTQMTDQQVSNFYGY